MTWKIFFSVLILFGFLTMPVFAETVQWNGAWVDSSEIPQLESQLPLPDEDSPAPQKTPSWGTSSWSSTIVGPCNACPRQGTIDFTAPNCVYLQPANASSSAYVGFPLDLPHGAVIQYVYIWYYDNHSTSDPSMGLWSSNNTGSDTLIQGLTPPAFDGGNNANFVGPFSHTVNNWGNNYYILAILDRDATTTQRIYRIIVWYKLAVSPSPATAAFLDVPTDHWAFRFIEALAGSGITGGCGGGNFCPDDNLTRAQMAVFLSKALGLHFPADQNP